MWPLRPLFNSGKPSLPALTLCWVQVAGCKRFVVVVRWSPAMEDAFLSPRMPVFLGPLIFLPESCRSPLLVLAVLLTEPWGRPPRSNSLFLSNPDSPWSKNRSCSAVSSTRQEPASMCSARSYRFEQMQAVAGRRRCKPSSGWMQRSCKIRSREDNNDDSSGSVSITVAPVLFPKRAWLEVFRNSCNGQSCGTL